MKSFTDFLALFWEPIAALICVGWLIAMMRSAWVKAWDNVSGQKKPDVPLQMSEAAHIEFCEFWLDLNYINSTFTRPEAEALYRNLIDNPELGDQQRVPAEVAQEKGKEAA